MRASKNTLNTNILKIIFHITVPDDVDDDVVSLPILDQLPEQVLNSLRLIATWLLSCGYETDFMQAYATVRSQVLVRSLQT